MQILDWKTYRQQLAAGVGSIAKTSPDIIKGYQALGAASRQTSLLGDKVNELIALAVAVTSRCDGCISVHTAAAIKAGATRAEIIEALGTAISVNAGAALVYSVRTLDAFDGEQAQ
ncbi:carboxymuconolactone decarboxylase family protein [Asticcacaulis sp. EMRT-3]|uniref:carboxymuconolactone decarboxylase family protein n=1 Tax=Asticcacaulis sp. EMRT-3 TaxID=3040349 RepID=UPI0024AEFA27|nr:carboxymuconolactone decarboxylase family protein [Asticcacaulis sp. EMRT-3]MDI7776476.1 carboxymuconolactone decarboxylase family protein [Asticcacaulis sp. EMRT-3]